MKTLGIMQPYFFPYLGYFDLINSSDEWIVFDEVQYIRHGWVNRNRILHPSSGWQYILVPLQKHPRETIIKDILTADNNAWKRRILGQLGHYKKHAPFYRQTIQLLEECFDSDILELSKLNIHFLKKCCERLSIDFKYSVFSEMNLPIGSITNPGDWALEICKCLNADRYINPPGGKDIFDNEAFQQSNVQLVIRDVKPFEYMCKPYEFESRLSVIDVFMWNSPEDIRSYLDDVKLQ